MPPARRTPSRQGTPARRGGGQRAGCPAGAHLWFTGHSREPAGLYFPFLELWFILERPTQLCLPSENSTRKNFRPGQAGLLGLSKAKVLPRPERATERPSTAFALSVMLRDILRSEEERKPSSKGELKTSLWSWVFSSSDTSTYSPGTHELSRPFSQASGISVPLPRAPHAPQATRCRTSIFITGSLVYAKDLKELPRRHYRIQMKNNQHGGEYRLQKQ